MTLWHRRSRWPAERSSLIRANVALFVLHTNYDTVPGGINDALAGKLGVGGLCPLTNRKQDKFYKMVVFVPEDNVEDVRNAMADAGAGLIGQYTHCSFRSPGIGSFVGLPAAQPYIGATGKLEEVEEVPAGDGVRGIVAGKRNRGHALPAPLR